MIRSIEQTAREELQKVDEPDEKNEEPPSDSGGGTPGQSEVGKFSQANRQFRSTSDPDATLVRQAGLKSRPRYKSHRVVDDAHEIITAVETATGAVDEGASLLALIEAHEDMTDQAVVTVASITSWSVKSLGSVLISSCWATRPEARDAVRVFMPKSTSFMIP